MPNSDLTAEESPLGPEFRKRFEDKLTREEIFAAMFKGDRIKETSMFKTITAYSPTGMPKKLPATPENLMKYEKYVISLKRYFQEGEAMGMYYDNKTRNRIARMIKKKLYSTKHINRKGSNRTTLSQLLVDGNLDDDQKDKKKDTMSDTNISDEMEYRGAHI